MWSSATELTAESIALLKSRSGISLTCVPPKTANVRAALEYAEAIITRSDFQAGRASAGRRAAPAIDRAHVGRADGHRHRQRQRARHPGDECAGRERRVSRRAHLGSDAGAESESAGRARQLAGRLVALRSYAANRRAAAGQDDRHRRLGTRGPAGGAIVPGAGHDRPGIRPLHSRRASQRQADSTGQLDRALAVGRLRQHARAGDEGDAGFLRRRRRSGK